MTIRRRAVTAGGLLCLLLALEARAQQPADLVTDRPDRTESTATVPRGSLQVELGAVWVFDGSSAGRLRVVEAPGTLVRYGALDRLELRLAWGGWVATTVETMERHLRADGFADPEIGFKWGILEPRQGGLGLAALGHVSLPLGDEVVGSPAFDPSVILAAAHPLGDRLALGANLGYALFSVQAGNATQTLGRWLYSASLGVEVAPRWGAFVELFGDLPADDPGPAVHALDGGLTYLARPRFQLDLSAGVGLNADAPDWFVGVGLSFRTLK
jgi:hypothetical protein